MYSEGAPAEGLITNNLRNMQSGIRSLCDQIDRLSKENLSERTIGTMKTLVNDSGSMIPTLRNQLMQ